MGLGPNSASLFLFSIKTQNKGPHRFIVEELHCCHCRNVLVSLCMRDRCMLSLHYLVLLKERKSKLDRGVKWTWIECLNVFQHGNYIDSISYYSKYSRERFKPCGGFLSIAFRDVQAGHIAGKKKKKKNMVWLRKKIFVSRFPRHILPWTGMDQRSTRSNTTHYVCLARGNPTVVKLVMFTVWCCARQVLNHLFALFSNLLCSPIMFFSKSLWWEEEWISNAVDPIQMKTNVQQIAVKQHLNTTM